MLAKAYYPKGLLVPQLTFLKEQHLALEKDKTWLQYESHHL